MGVVLAGLFQGNTRKFYFARCRGRINGRSKKKDTLTSHPCPSANERVYVSAVADRVNVGKDEGLRFSG